MSLQEPNNNNTPEERMIPSINYNKIKDIGTTISELYNPMVRVKCAEKCANFPYIRKYKSFTFY